MNDLSFDQIEGELELYERGRELRLVVNSPSWETLTNTMGVMRDRAIQDLIRIAPGDPSVVAAHAAASAVNDFVSKFLDATQRAVDFANNPSAEVIAYLTQARDAMDVAKATGQGV